MGEENDTFGSVVNIGTLSAYSEGVLMHDVAFNLWILSSL